MERVGEKLHAFLTPALCSVHFTIRLEPLVPIGQEARWVQSGLDGTENNPFPYQELNPYCLIPSLFTD
jgi:hypothetical protein